MYTVEVNLILCTIYRGRERVVTIGTVDKYSHSFPSGHREVFHVSGLCEIMAMRLAQVNGI